jgi:hypothetical protein
MRIDKYTNLVLEKLERRKGFARLHLLYEQLSLLDHGIFNESGIIQSEYRIEIISMLNDDDIAVDKLSTLFSGYKEGWLESKRKYFESLEEIDYKNFIKEFKDLLPQDIRDAIKKCKSVDLSDLTLNDSVNSFIYYHEIREWLKARIAQELEVCKLSDNELLLLSDCEKIKYEWLGNAVDLVGLLGELEAKNWIVPPGSFREKSTYILKCFKFSSKDIKIDSITNIYKKSSMNYEPFNKIIKRS